MTYQAPLSMGFSREEYCNVFPFLLQWIFLIQGLNWSLLHPLHWPGFFYHWATYIAIPWWIGRGYIFRQGFLIRIKACDNLSFFLLLQSFKRVKLLRLVGLLILMSLSGPFNLAPGGLLLLLPWLPNVLPFGTLRRSWKLEFCLQEIGDQKVSMPRNPTGLCLASQSILLPFKELKTNLRLNPMSPAYHPHNPIFCWWVGMCYLLVFCPEAKLW